MFKASELVTFCKSMIGMPYWYGTCVYPCTESRLTSKAKQYPSHYTSSRMPTYRKHIAAGYVCMDCIGMIKGFFWTDGGKGVLEYIKNGTAYTNKYVSNGFPDRSANGMLSWLKSQGCKNGKIATLPDVPGILLFSPGHVGVYVGGGYAVEARGFNYGVVKTKVSERKWTDWAYLPESLLQYDGAVVKDEEYVKDETTTKTYKLGDRLLKKASPLMSGNDVKEVQTNLNVLGYNCGTVDGQFGTKTEEAVKKFQKANGLTVDGQYGAKSHAAMVAALEKKNSGTTAPVPNGKTVTITGNSVNIRKGPGTSYGILKAVNKGTQFEKVDASGWVCIKYNNAICWVSGNYVKSGACTASSLNVRKGPSTDYAIVGTVKNGYTFDVIGTNGWVPILISGVIYWVSGKYAI